MQKIRMFRTEIQKLTKYVKIIDIICLVISFLNLSLAYAENVQYFTTKIEPLMSRVTEEEYIHTDFNEYLHEIGINLSDNQFSDSARYINIFICIVLDIFIVFHYKI